MTLLPVDVTRWTFEDKSTSEKISVPINPNQMSTPTYERSMNWAWGSRWGHDRMRGMQTPQPSPTQWTFSGVLFEKSHYDLLLAWTQRLKIIRITDHLLRQFDVIIQQFDPVERRRTPQWNWRSDYTITCLLLKQAVMSPDIPEAPGTITPGSGGSGGGGPANAMIVLEMKVFDGQLWTAGSASLSLAATGVAVMGATTSASGSGSVTLVASGAIQTSVGSVSAALSLSATGSVRGSAAGTGSLSLSATGVPAAAFTGTAALALSASGSAATLNSLSGTGSLSLSASGSVSAATSGSGSVTLSATGAAASQVTGSGSLSLSASGSARGVAAGSGSITLSGSGTAAGPSALAAWTTAATTDSAWGIWKMTETSGTTLADSSGNSRPMTISGSPTLAQTGPDGGVDAILWPNATASASSTTATTTASTATWESWVYMTAYPSANTSIVGNTGGGGAFDKHLFVNPSGQVQSYIYSSSSGRKMNTIASLDLNTWYHVALSCGAAGNKLYVNGALVAVNATWTSGDGSTVSATVRGAPGAMNGGGTLSGTGPLYVGPSAFYASQLSDSRIAAHAVALVPTLVPMTTPLPGRSAYASAVLTDTPVSYYKMNETSGSTLTDSSGNAHDGTYQNSPTLGGTGAGVTFNGTNQYASFPTTGLPSGSSSYTLEAMFKPTATSSTRGILGIGQYNSGNRANALRVLNQDLAAEWWNNDYQLFANVNTAWQHVVTTWDGTTQAIYLNSVLIGSRTTAAPNVTLLNPAIATTNGGEYFSGAIAEVAVYTTALTSTRVTAHYAASLG